MNSYTFQKLVQEIMDWTYTTDFPGGVQISCTKSQLQTLLNYSLNLQLDSHFTSRMLENLSLNEAWPERFRPQNYKRIAALVVSFLQDLRELFHVPELQQLFHMDSTLKKNELVAGFISFLLQLLNPLSYFFTLFRLPVVEELRFLVTILGASPFQTTEDEQVQSLLAEFEQVANKAGSLVHSIIFVPDDPVLKRILEELGALLERIRVLKEDIIEFLDLSPNGGVVVKENCEVDSFFIIHSLVCDLVDVMNRDDEVIVEVRDQIRALHRGLILSQSLLDGLRLLQCLEIEELKEPVMQIRDVAHEAEYLIKSFLVGDAPRWYLVIRLDHHIMKIKFNVTILEGITKQDYYGALALNVTRDFGTHLSMTGRQDPLANNVIVGFEDQEADILDRIVLGTQKLQIVFIFGMPGLGKTTLARKLYNHPLVGHHFHKSSWCVVSQMYKRKNLLVNILTNFRSDEADSARILNMDDESLDQEIYQSLKGRRYLIVIDDIWSSSVWEDLQKFFPDDRNGSRILITSRNRDVAPLGSIIHELPFLSNDQCWDLLQKKVFHGKPCPSQLQETGKKIAANCYGLPLAVVVIAGILSTMDKEESAWKNVGGSLGSYMFSDQGNPMMQILELSYKHLPRHLKPCFLYLGVFQEDAEIPVKKLMHMWIAEGFIHKEENKTVESLAEEYLRELIDKSLVIIAKKRSDGGAKICIVHDLLRDLCLKTAEKENFLKLIDHDTSIWHQKFPRLCVQANPMTYPSPCHLVPYSPRLRSFIGSFLDSSLSVLNMKSLRVLDCGTKFNYPDFFEIECLVHLRYLALNRMLSSISFLANLEFLIVNDRVQISSLIPQMAKLRYLRTREAFLDRNQFVLQVNNLEFLSSLCMQNTKDEEMLRYSPRLRRLKCKYDRSWKANTASTCLDIHFLARLESLTVISYLGKPRITTIKFPVNIKKLNLCGLHFPWAKMSIIGVLPNLETLKLSLHAFEGQAWDTCDDEFKQLRFLKLMSLDLTHWNVSSCDHFPKLRHLALTNCYNLMGIPCEIGEIATLQSIEVHEWCRKSLIESVVPIQEQQREMGNEELRVIINVPQP